MRCLCDDVLLAVLLAAIAFGLVAVGGLTLVLAYTLLQAVA